MMWDDKRKMVARRITERDKERRGRRRKRENDFGERETKRPKNEKGRIRREVKRTGMIN